MVLDEFVYDPDAETGSLVINATKGVFRLVGGKISKKNPVLLKTPTATIGIRGGINYTVIGDNSLQTINGFGQTTVESEGVRITIDRPGYGSTVVPGEPPSLPVLIDAAAMEAAFNSLESSGEASGGSEDPPDDSDVAASGVGEGGSDNDPSAIAPSEGVSLEDLLGIGEASDAAEDTAELSETQQDLAATGSGVSAGDLSGNFRACGSSGCELGASFSNVLTFSGGAISGGVFSVEIASFLTVPGVTFGEFSFTGDSPEGAISGTGFFTNDSEFLFIEASVVADPNNKVIAFAGTPTTTFPTSGITFYALQDDFPLGSSVPFIPNTQGGVALGGGLASIDGRYGHCLGYLRVVQRAACLRPPYPGHGGAGYEPTIGGQRYDG